MNDDKIDGLDLDRRLGELFDGAGLDLVPRSGATGTVLARVRRVRRRRRAMLVAAPVLTVACLAGAILATQDGRDLGAPAPPARASDRELTMSGTSVGPLRLGMTAAQAEATGLLDVEGREDSYAGTECAVYSGKDGVLSVEISPRGVDRIRVYPFIHTPEAIAVGARYRDLHAAYPTSTPATPDTRDRYRVPVPGTDDAWYEFVLESLPDGQLGRTQDSRIAAVILRTKDSTCG